MDTQRKITTLIVLAENFGLNFSGGSSATIYLLEHLHSFFKSVKVVCKKEGIHPFQEISFIKYNRVSEVKGILAEMDTSEAIGYADFHIASELIGEGLPFYLTYHDNWPDMLNFEEDKIWAQNRIETYGKIFQAAECVFSVSEDRMKFIHQYTDNTILVRNGLTLKPPASFPAKKKKGEPLKVVMAGNVDKRKYSKAVRLFELLNELDHCPLHIEIFGHELDPALSTELNKFPFVSLMGFRDELTFENHHLLLNTSVVENLSLSVVDAVAHRMPVLAFDVGGLREVVDGFNGKLAKAFNVEEMRDFLVACMEDKIEFSFNEEKLIPFNWKASALKMKKAMKLTA